MARLAGVVPGWVRWSREGTKWKSMRLLVGPFVRNRLEGRFSPLSAASEGCFELLQFFR